MENDIETEKKQIYHHLILKDGEKDRNMMALYEASLKASTLDRPLGPIQKLDILSSLSLLSEVSGQEVSSPAHSSASSASTSFTECELMEMDQESKDGNAGFHSNSFVKKLYHMITSQDPEILSFTPDGTAFHVKDPRRLELEILPKYFRHSRFQSLVRQLNFYNFKKVSKERVVWIYKHKFFQEGRPELLDCLKRKPNATFLKARSSSLQEDTENSSPYGTKGSVPMNLLVDIYEEDGCPKKGTYGSNTNQKQKWTAPPPRAISNAPNQWIPKGPQVMPSSEKKRKMSEAVTQIKPKKYVAKKSTHLSQPPPFPVSKLSDKPRALAHGAGELQISNRPYTNAPKSCFGPIGRLSNYAPSVKSSGYPLTNSPFPASGNTTEDEGASNMYDKEKRVSSEMGSDSGTDDEKEAPVFLMSNYQPTENDQKAWCEVAKRVSPKLSGLKVLAGRNPCLGPFHYELAYFLLTTAPYQSSQSLFLLIKQFLTNHSDLATLLSIHRQVIDPRVGKVMESPAASNSEKAKTFDIPAKHKEYLLDRTKNNSLIRDFLAFAMRHLQDVCQLLKEKEERDAVDAAFRCWLEHGYRFF